MRVYWLQRWHSLRSSVRRNLRWHSHTTNLVVAPGVRRNPTRMSPTRIVAGTVIRTGSAGARAMILKSETYNFYRLDLTRQAGFIVTVYDEDGLMLAATMPRPTPAKAFAEARKIVDNKVEGPRK